MEHLRDTGTAIAHCPTSNQLLGSGVMNLDEVIRREISYALGTDVGASPTVSMLAEMGRFARMHEGRSSRAMAGEALFRSTWAPAEILGIDAQVGRLEAGFPMSFIEIELGVPHNDAESVIRSLLPHDLDHPPNTVNRVTIAGQTIFDRSGSNA